MELILSGNPNTDTIKNVLYFVNKRFENKIKKVCFIDTIKPIYNSNEKTLKQQKFERENYVKCYLGEKVSIEIKSLEENELHIKIPEILKEQLKLYKKSEIIVDLTNGTKYISNILYATACFSQIENIFFLFIPYDKQKTPPEKLEEKDYKINIISPLENWQDLGKSIYFEVFYYMDKADYIKNSFLKYKLFDGYLKEELNTDLKIAIENYFLENFKGTIITLGRLTEKISKEIWRKIYYRLFKDSKSKFNIPKDFNESIKLIRKHFCKPFQDKKNEENFNELERDFKNLRLVDKLLDLIRVHRNQAAHPYTFLVNKEEARIVLNATLYLLTLLIKSKIF
ncbi:MAG: hypothetical protein ACTSVV_14550 [Promethearchaeota archaeon]